MGSESAAPDVQVNTGDDAEVAVAPAPTEPTEPDSEATEPTPEPDGAESDEAASPSE